MGVSRTPILSVSPWLHGHGIGRRKPHPTGDPWQERDHFSSFSLRGHPLIRSLCRGLGDPSPKILPAPEVRRIAADDSAKGEGQATAIQKKTKIQIKPVGQPSVGDSDCHENAPELMGVRKNPWRPRRSSPVSAIPYAKFFLSPWVSVISPWVSAIPAQNPPRDAAPSNLRDLATFMGVYSCPSPMPPHLPASAILTLRLRTDQGSGIRVKKRLFFRPLGSLDLRRSSESSLHHHRPSTAP